MVKRRIPLPLADEINVLFGIPAATVAVALGGALGSVLAYVHGGPHRGVAAGAIGFLTLAANLRVEDAPLYRWTGLVVQFLLAPRIYVCPPSMSLLEAEVNPLAKAHAKTFSY